MMPFYQKILMSDPFKSYSYTRFLTIGWRLIGALIGYGVSV